MPKWIFILLNLLFGYFCPFNNFYIPSKVDSFRLIIKQQIKLCLRSRLKNFCKSISYPATLLFITFNNFYLNNFISLYTSIKSGDPVNDKGEIGPKNINGYFPLLLGSINDL